MKVQIKVNEPRYVTGTLKAGQRFRFAGDSATRHFFGDPDPVLMAVKVCHGGSMNFESSEETLGWTALSGNDAGKIYRFDEHRLGPRMGEAIELVEDE